jgi:hypothetical protein
VGSAVTPATERIGRGWLDEVRVHIHCASAVFVGSDDAVLRRRPVRALHQVGIGSPVPESVGKQPEFGRPFADERAGGLIPIQSHRPLGAAVATLTCGNGGQPDAGRHTLGECGWREIARAPVARANVFCLRRVLVKLRSTASFGAARMCADARSRIRALSPMLFHSFVAVAPSLALA